MDIIILTTFKKSVVLYIYKKVFKESSHKIDRIVWGLKPIWVVVTAHEI